MRRGIVLGTLVAVGALSLTVAGFQGQQRPRAKAPDIQKLIARLPAETPEGQPAELGFGVHVPFGPMLGLAALIYFFWAHTRVDAYFRGLQLLF